MLKHSLAILVASAAPAAADRVMASHEARYQGETFICGKIEHSGWEVRNIHSIPRAKYIAEFEPNAGDPLAQSWMITYRIICEGWDSSPFSRHA